MRTLTAFYDLDSGPVSFDFVTFLVRAMKERDERSCNGLHIVVVPKENGLGGFSRNWGKHDEHAARWRLWHIVVASCPLAGATVTVAASIAQAEDMCYRNSGSDSSGAPLEMWWPLDKAHFMGPLVEAARNGEMIPKLRATEGARRYVDQMLKSSVAPQGGGALRPFVTLTLRNQTTDETRNTNSAEWGQLYTWLVSRGYYVFMLRDTNEALGLGQGYAQLDPDLRLALYERADMNLIGNNGPQELLKFSDAPYLIFNLGIESWREHFRKYFKMEFGDQLPWAGKKQRLVYAPDTFDVMRTEFERMCHGLG